MHHTIGNNKAIGSVAVVLQGRQGSGRAGLLLVSDHIPIKFINRIDLIKCLVSAVAHVVLTTVDRRGVHFQIQFYLQINEIYCNTKILL